MYGQDFSPGQLSRWSCPSAEVREAVAVGGRRQIFIFEGKEQVFIFGNDEPEYFVRHLSGDFK